MEIYIEKYVDYLKNIKKSSENTVASYQRDLVKFSDFYRENGTEDIRSINETNINTYVLYLEKNGKSMATVSRSSVDQVVFRIPFSGEDTDGRSIG